MHVGRFAAFSRGALFRPLLSGAPLAGRPLPSKPLMQPDVLKRKFSAYASLLAAGHSTTPPHAHFAASDDQLPSAFDELGVVPKANVQVELGLRFHECASNRLTVLELELDELAEAAQLFVQRRRDAGLSGGEDALHALADSIAEGAPALYFNELDTRVIAADPMLTTIFQRLWARGVKVLCPPPIELERRSIGSALGV